MTDGEADETNTFAKVKWGDEGESKHKTKKATNSHSTRTSGVTEIGLHDSIWELQLLSPSMGWYPSRAGGRQRLKHKHVQTTTTTIISRSTTRGATSWRTSAISPSTISNLLQLLSVQEKDLIEHTDWCVHWREALPWAPSWLTLETKSHWCFSNEKVFVGDLVDSLTKITNRCQAMTGLVLGKRFSLHFSQLDAEKMLDAWILEFDLPAWNLCENVIVHTSLPPPVQVWIEFVGKPKWLPLILINTKNFWK